MDITNKTILIIGGTGSLGYALTKEHIKSNRIFIYSRGENNQWLMKQDFKNDANLQFIIGDIRDKECLEKCLDISKPNIIIIAAALKHIDICENNIEECINTNVLGIKNIANLISSRSMVNTIPFLESVIFISTDKACAPVNVYGMCKAISERIVVEKSQILTTPKFINVRYGNVISSRGSIIPFFKNIAKDPEQAFFPITSEKMTRYFMHLDQSIDLIKYAILQGQSGDTIIPKNINSHKIVDIANMFSLNHNKPTKIIGIRPGEKLHETLICFTESLKTVEKDGYYIIKSSRQGKIDNHVIFPNGEFNSSSTVDITDSSIFE